MNENISWRRIAVLVVASVVTSVVTPVLYFSVRHIIQNQENSPVVITTQLMPPKESGSTLLQPEVFQSGDGNANETSTEDEYPISPRDRVLSRAKVTKVVDRKGPYKTVVISDNSVTFSFEVPDAWLSETRNSGEVVLNTEELREFFATNYDGDIRKNPGLSGDYWDFSWDMLRDMPDAEMREDYRSKRDEFFLGFPNASVTSQGYISYMDMAWRQVDFYILDKKRDKSYLEGMVYSRDLFGDYVKKDKKLRLLLT